MLAKHATKCSLLAHSKPPRASATLIHRIPKKPLSSRTPKRNTHASTLLKEPWRFPKQTWDTHTHITPLSTHPPPPSTSSGATYTPHDAPLSHLRQHLFTHGISNVVLVQPSTYGFDNSCLLWGLGELNGFTSSSSSSSSSTRDIGEREGKKGRARGVAVINSHDPPSRDELRDWHALGVRGIRLNLHSVGRSLNTPLAVNEVKTEIKSLLRAIEHFDQQWNLQVFASMGQLFVLNEFLGGRDGLMGQGTRLVVDHCGMPDLAEGLVRDERGEWKGEVEGAMTPLMRLLEREYVYVKLSAPYRLLPSAIEKGDYAQLEPLVRQFIKVREGKAALWASDWPHTRFEDSVGEGEVRRWAEWVGELCGDDVVTGRVLGGNAGVIYGGD